MSAADPLRVLVVGSPRSGTTFAQRLLAEHLDLLTLPETRLAIQAGSRRAVLADRGWARIGARAAIEERLGLEVPAVPRWRRLRTVAHVAAATRRLDAEAVARGHRGWVEKTPVHLRHLATFEAACAPRVLHVVRDGAAVVASVVEVTEAHPEVWGGPRSPEEAALRWAADVDHHRRWAGAPGHVVVRYDDLVASPRETLDLVAARWGVEPGPARTVSAEELVRPHEVWKRDVTGAVPAAERAARDERARRLAARPEVAGPLEAGRRLAAALPYLAPATGQEPSEP